MKNTTTHTHASRFSGIITALITPFRDGRIDERSFQDLVEWQVSEGISGIVPCGTTGEAPALSETETARLYALAVEAAARRVPVIAGCGSNNTAHAVHLTRLAQDAGADAALHVAPYYNRPQQLGLYRHFKAVHDATSLPIILYNIPGRTGVNIALHTQGRLAQLPRIAGVKDCSGDITRPVRTRACIRREFAQLSGDDANLLPFLAQGGDGVISVTANIAPRLCTALFNAWSRGDVKTAQGINARLLPLHDALFTESSPAPVKYAASRMGLCENELRLPLVRASRAAIRTVDDAMDRLCLPAPSIPAPSIPAPLPAVA